jgi:hypothetical protein
MSYELWDAETGNLLGSYLTEVEALATVRAVVASHGRETVQTWELAREDAEADTETLLAGEALIERASTMPQARSA